MPQHKMPQSRFQRVLQRAVFPVKSSGQDEVGVENILLAIFKQR
jgi:ATP-dependent Clp protease ATP-binding subunit ClpA